MKHRSPSYVLIFLIIGILLLASSYTLSPGGERDKFIALSLAQVAFILLTVSILEFIWDLLGGEPIKQTLDDLRASVNLLVVQLEQMVPSPGPTKARIPGRRLPAGGYLLSASDH